jgi:hypothetical protein
MQPRKRKGLVQVKLRIPEELKRRLDREAKKRTDGSLSAEIADRLERSFTWPKIEEATASAVAKELKRTSDATASTLSKEIERLRDESLKAVIERLKAETVDAVVKEVERRGLTPRDRREAS